VNAGSVLVRREGAGDVEVIRAVTAAAFARAGEGVPAEAPLVDELRASSSWIPELSLVALDPAGDVVGHVVCTRGRVGAAPVLGLGPLSVRPDRWRQGTGSALMHAVLGAADALGEPLVALLGSAEYYPRFGFRLAAEYGITPAHPEWAPHFQVRTLTAYDPAGRGEFAYPAPFGRVLRTSGVRSVFSRSRPASRSSSTSAPASPPSATRAAHSPSGRISRPDSRQAPPRTGGSLTRGSAG
jgi:putative acetyltransferase